MTDENTVNPVPMDDDPLPAIKKLKTDIEGLAKLVKGMMEEMTGLANSQKAMTGAILKNDQQLTQLKTDQAKANAGMPSEEFIQGQIMKAMQKFVDQVAAKVQADNQTLWDAKVGEFLESQAQQGGGQAVVRAGPIGLISGLLSDPNTLSSIKELVSIFKPTPVAPQMQMGDMFAGFLRFEKVLGELSDVRHTLDNDRIEKVRQETNAAFKTPAGPTQPPA